MSTLHDAVKHAVRHVEEAGNDIDAAFYVLVDAIEDVLKDNTDLIETLQQRDERIVELEEEIAELRGHREYPHWGQP